MKIKPIPKKGYKLIFMGVPEFYYPMFTNIGKNARDTLELGKEYTVRNSQVYSSWSQVWLEGTEGDEVSDGFHRTFFKIKNKII